MNRRSFQHERAAPKPARMPETPRSHPQPLDASLRAFFEPRFGHDFSRVRVHTGSEAAGLAREMKARAYSAGDEIVLGEKALEMSTPEGFGAIAHELAHVVQQHRGGSNDRSGAEAGAHAAVEQLARGGEAGPSLVGGAAPGVYCLGEDDPPPITISEDQRNRLLGLVKNATSAATAAPATGFKTPHLAQLGAGLPKAPQPNILPQPLPGPRAQQADPNVLQALAPKKTPQSAAAPETLSIPGVSGYIKAAIRLSPPSPDTKVAAGKITPAYTLAWVQNQLTKAELLGNPPPPIDKGELVKILYSIISTYFLADFTAKLAGAFTSKDKGGLQWEITINVPSSGPGSTVKAAFSSAGHQIASVPMLGFSFKF